VVLLLAMGALAADLPPGIVAWQQAVRAATDATAAAVPTLARCPVPAGAAKLVVSVDLEKNAASTAAMGGQEGKVHAPCIETGILQVFAKNRPILGRTAVVVLDTAAGLRLDGDVALLGSLSHDAIESGMRAHMAQFVQCYLDAYADAPTLEGQVTVSFTVLPNGAVNGPAMRHTTLFNPATEACVVHELSSVTFVPPDGGGIVRVTYPFEFHPPK
jgi:hypothetical protein